MIVAFGLGMAATAMAAMPKLEFDRTVYNFGLTSGVPSLSGKFIYTNTGDAELKLQKPMPDCGCTVAMLQPDTLQPGEKGELVFTLTLAGLQGRIVKTIAVPSNDPRTPLALLTLQAEYRPKFEVTPLTVNVNDLRGGATGTGTFMVHRTDGARLVISRLDSGAGVEARAETVDDQTTRVVLQVQAFGSARRFSDMVRVYAEGETSPVGTVTVYGRVVGDLLVAPETLFWGLANTMNWPGSGGDSVAVRTLTVTATTTNAPLAISDLNWDVPDLMVQEVQIEKGKNYSIIARLTKPPKESVKGTITFSTGVPSQPQVVVPVTINVMR